MIRMLLVMVLSALGLASPCAPVAAQDKKEPSPKEKPASWPAEPGLFGTTRILGKGRDHRLSQGLGLNWLGRGRMPLRAPLAQRESW
jgi:hypothetical protein